MTFNDFLNYKYKNKKVNEVYKNYLPQGRYSKYKADIIRIFQYETLNIKKAYQIFGIENNLELNYNNEYYDNENVIYSYSAFKMYVKRLTIYYSFHTAEYMSIISNNSKYKGFQKINFHYDNIFNKS